MYCVHIFKDDSMKEIKIKGKNILKSLAKITTNSEINELYSWDYDNITTKCYGSYDGEPGLENKHELPPNGISNFLEEDSSEKLLFNDIFILRFKQDKLIDTTISDYGEFYNLVFNGFDDCISDSDSYFSSEDEDKINNHSETDEDFEIISDENDENSLDSDNNNY